MAEINVNMKQFRAKWRDYSDNIKFGDSIRASNGKVLTLDPRGYEEWLNEFGIFYTRKNPMAKITLYSHLGTRKTAAKKTVRKTAAKNPRRKIKTIEHKTFGKSSFSVFDAKTKKFLGAFPSLLAAKQYGQAYADLHDKQVSILK